MVTDAPKALLVTTAVGEDMNLLCTTVTNENGPVPPLVIGATPYCIVAPKPP